MTYPDPQHFRNVEGPWRVYTHMGFESYSKEEAARNREGELRRFFGPKRWPDIRVERQEADR